MAQYAETCSLLRLFPFAVGKVVMISKKWVVSILAIAFSSSAAFAQNASTQQAPPASAQKLEKLDSKTAGIGVRASKLIGMNIQNSRKESVGQIKDIVLDPASTRIQYVAVTYGGFLGLGDKLFAVPMQAIKVQTDPDNRDRVILVMDVTKEQMNGAQGFDEAHWPNFSDRNFSGDLHRRYGVEDRWNHGVNHDHDGKVDANVGRQGVKVRVDGDRK